MNIRNRFYLSYRYFIGHFRRYLFLIISVALGFAVITSITSLSSGMYESVYRTAEQHYGGQLLVLGFEKESGNLGLVEENGVLEDAVSLLKIQPEETRKRTLFFAEGTLYFGGKSSRQKNIYGLDWQNEIQDLEKLDYSDGGPISGEDDTGILISEPVSEQLGIRVGDDLTMKIRTRTGQHNTGTFIVRGIFRDKSLFGHYKSYISRSRLNELLVFEKDSYSSIGLYFKDKNNASAQADQLYELLKGRVNLSPPIEKKEQYSHELTKDWSGIRYFVMTLEIFVSQVSDMLAAMDLLSYFLYLMITLIILVSVSVTYRLIVQERTAEIGTMRSMGFQKGDLLGIFLGEAAIVFLIALILGGILASISLYILSFQTFDFIPGFEIFMNRGRLLPLIRFKDIASNILILAVIIFPAVWFPSHRASSLELTRAMTGNI